MIFDTAAGELSPAVFQSEILPQLQRVTSGNAERIGYYSKGTQPAHLRHPFFAIGSVAGIGVDHGWDIRDAFDVASSGFVQGNFDQALLHTDAADLRMLLAQAQPQHPQANERSAFTRVRPGETLLDE